MLSGGGIWTLLIRPVTLWLQVVGARFSADPGAHRSTLDLAAKKCPALVRGHLSAEADKPSCVPKDTHSWTNQKCPKGGGPDLGT